MPCQVRDETYVKVKGKWAYYYRAIDKFGKTHDFMLSEHRGEAAATAFFTRLIGNNGFPDKVVIDKSGANLAGLQNINCLLILNEWFWLIEVLQVKYLDNIIEHPSCLMNRVAPVRDWGCCPARHLCRAAAEVGPFPSWSVWTVSEYARLRLFQ